MGEMNAFAGDSAENGKRVPVKNPTHSQDADGIIPPDRMTLWNPGLKAIGGIPKRTKIYKTLSPRGGSLDDTAAIQAALNTCPRGRVVKLAPGTFNINGNGLFFRKSDCTLRGSGTGALGSGKGGTRLIKADRTTNPNAAVLYVGGGGVRFSSSYDLTEDAVKSTNSLKLAKRAAVKRGDIVLIDQVTNDDPRVWWGPEHNPPGGGSRRWFARQDRSLSQIMEVTAVKGKTITFSTPFHITFKTKYAAQLSRFAYPAAFRIGIEDLYVYGGMGGDYHGNISVILCAYCWVKNVEAHWSVGTSIGFYATFRSELRDSYIHETPDPNPGGAGYLVGLNRGASENLVENNVIWSGNKVIVMRATGGGNVIAYNYMDDAYGSTYPHMPEAGLNAGHYTTPHMELLEGNYSHRYQGDSFWGNSIYITVFRNHLSGLRARRPPLDKYKFRVYPYMDLQRRAAVDVQAHSDYTNFVGNVLGFQGQPLLSYNQPGYNFKQNAWTYERLGAFPRDDEVPMWSIGSLQAGGWKWIPETYRTQLREGNWDWVTQSQRWHGIGGTAGSGTPRELPNSLYLTEKPTFFGSNPWPWVNPSNGTVTSLPAKACLEQGKMPNCMMPGG
ncbi:MAG: right-handed parallel beta-helix repeat-containing protein [Alphaproteobacteria bacterium]